MNEDMLIKLLMQLDGEMAQQMLRDLKDEAKRTPQLYNAIGKLLDRHKFKINAIQPDKDILGGLGDALAEYDEMNQGGLNEADFH